MHIDLNALKDAFEAGIDFCQMFAYGYLDVFVAIGTGLALALKPLTKMFSRIR